MGYFRGLRHGAVLGAVAALLFAPDAGTVTRRRLAVWLGEIQGSSEPETGTSGGEGARTSRRRSAPGRAAAHPKRPADK